jgi:hypothetical protein
MILLGMVATASAAASERHVQATATPTITSVSPIGTTRVQTIIIKGRGFGTFVGYTGDSDFISFLDLSTHPQWGAGYSPRKDTVGLLVKSWSNTEIVLTGFTKAWGEHNWTLHKGDKEQIKVWNWQSNPFTSKPATTTVTVK